MSVKNLYIISGCNGAGKTTASFTVLPEMLDCREFVNADIIAYGLSPLNPESVAIEAGRLMLQRIEELLSEGVDFAFETTLATRSYANLVKRAQARGYEVTLLYFWLNSPVQAQQRVRDRVSKGGHNIPLEVIERRYYRGIYNFFKLYSPICDRWLLLDNTMGVADLVAQGKQNFEKSVVSTEIWHHIQQQVQI